MTTVDKFTLFSFDEFRNWLIPFQVSRHIKLVQNHHTWLPDYSLFNGNNHFQLLKSMEKSHLERGFSEIAQNLTSFPDGKIALCRSLDKIPAGIKGANTYGVCIENLGNFDIGKDNMADAHRDTILRLNALLCKKFILPTDTDSIVYHHWYDLDTGQRTNGSGNTKTCPGTNFFGGNTVQNCQENFIPRVKDAFAILGPITEEKIILHGEVSAILLNVRAAANSTANIVQHLTQRTPIAIYEQKDNWYRISVGQWVSKDYITLV